MLGDDRNILGKAIVNQFMRALEGQLQRVSSLTPTPDQKLSGPTSAAFVALSLTYDIFPALSRFYPSSRTLYEVVNKRPTLTQFYKRDKEARLKMPWTLAEYGQVDYIREAAEWHEENDRKLFEDLMNANE